MTRVAIGMISHETNSFSPVPTTIESFMHGRRGLSEGRSLVTQARGTKTGLGGFIEVGDANGWEMVGTVAAGATPSANVAAAAHDELKGKLVHYLREAGPLDGVLLHLHGAMLAENAPDAEGDICRAVREVIGPDVPLIVELDLHGNITAEFCRVVDGVFAYNTNPHIDAYERGVEAANCLAAILNGELARPTVSISKPPMLPATINMRTAEGPMRKLRERAEEWEAGPGIVEVSVFGGFPFADFADAGTAILVTAIDPAAGQGCADEMGKYAWSLREEFLKPLPPVEEAVEQAMEMVAKAQPDDLPVILADVADNPGGGGSGDTPELLRELVRAGASGAVACIWDPESVERAFSLGIGAEAAFQIGGKVAPEAYGPPVEVRGTVTHLSDGRIIGRGPVVRGGAIDCGRTARVDAGGLKLVLTSVRHAANDRAYFQVAGVVPEREPLLVIKSRGHFRADFEPISRAIIEVDAPGAANPNLDRFEFKNVRRPIFPLDRDTAWEG